MTPLELTLLALCATLWTLGASITSSAHTVANGNPGTLTERAVILLGWPFIVLWVVVSA